MKFAQVLVAAAMAISTPAMADSKAVLIDEISGYLEFIDYGGAVIFAEQIPRAEYSKMMVIDARDAGQKNSGDA